MSSIDPDTPAVQHVFAGLIGVTPQAVSARVRAGQLKENGTYREWLQAYCEKLRRESSWRGGEDQSSLVRARTQQALADARMKDLTYYRELKLLVPVDEIEPLLANWAAMARSETTFAVEKLIAAIQSQHRIEVDQQLIDDTLHAAFRSIGSYPAHLGAGSEEVSEGE